MQAVWRACKWQGKNLTRYGTHRIQVNGPHTLVFPSPPSNKKIFLKFRYLENSVHFSKHCNPVKRQCLKFSPKYSFQQFSGQMKNEKSKSNQTMFNTMHTIAPLSVWSSKRNKPLISTKRHKHICLKNYYIFTDIMNKAAVQTEVKFPTAEKPSARFCNKS